MSVEQDHLSTEDGQVVDVFAGNANASRKMSVLQGVTGKLELVEQALANNAIVVFPQSISVETSQGVIAEISSGIEATPALRRGLRMLKNNLRESLAKDGFGDEVKRIFPDLTPSDAAKELREKLNAQEE